MDIKTVNTALVSLKTALPQEPEWIVLIRENGELIGKVGEYPYLTHRAIDDSIVVSAIHDHETHLLNVLDRLKQGNLQYSITVGSDRTFLLVNLNDAYVLVIAFVGVTSYDTLVDRVLLYSRDLLDAVNPDGKASKGPRDRWSS
jgi:hypothetical protein